MILLKLLLFLCIGCEELKSEVINDFTNCQNFFYKGIAPVIDYESDPTDICQKFGDNYYYATKYLKEWRIPLFSAYKLECFECVNSPQPKRRDTWFVEPQVSQFALHAFRKLSYRESPIKVPLGRKFIGLFRPNSVAEYRVLFIFLQKTEQQTFHPNIF